jgi:hypothetical protein
MLAGRSQVPARAADDTYDRDELANSLRTAPLHLLRHQDCVITAHAVGATRVSTEVKYVHLQYRRCCSWFPAERRAELEEWSWQFQQIQSEFQQLGKDLQAGNLTQAQQDYATLSQNFSNAQTSTATATANNSNPVAQAFTALSQDLQNGQHLGRARGLRQHPAGFSATAGNQPSPSSPSPRRRRPAKQ